MGTDIHAFLEVKVNGQWKDKNLYSMYMTKEADGSSLKKFTANSFYDGRSYTLFAMLANVRNSYGIKPISALRGLPEDSCQSTLDMYGGKIRHDLPASWLLASELLKAHEDYKNYTISYNPSSKESASEVLAPFIEAMKEQLYRMGFFVYDNEFVEKAKDVRVVFSFSD